MVIFWLVVGYLAMGSICVAFIVFADGEEPDFGEKVWLGFVGIFWPIIFPVMVVGLAGAVLAKRYRKWFHE